jgi:hypothetical protein
MDAVMGMSWTLELSHLSMFASTPGRLIPLPAVRPEEQTRCLYPTTGLRFSTWVSVTLLLCPNRMVASITLLMSTLFGKPGG